MVLFPCNPGILTASHNFDREVPDDVPQLITCRQGLRQHFQAGEFSEKAAWSSGKSGKNSAVAVKVWDRFEIRPRFFGRRIGSDFWTAIRMPFDQPTCLWASLWESTHCMVCSLWEPSTPTHLMQVASYMGHSHGHNLFSNSADLSLKQLSMKLNWACQLSLRISQL